MRIVFMGSDDIAIPGLEAFHQHTEMEVICVVTQPDRPGGRKMKLQPCAVKARAMEMGLPVHDPEKIGDVESVERLSTLKPDLQIVVAYGQYIPASVRDLPAHGSINLHPSMLPKYRGAAPIQMAIADGLTQTGISILYVSKEMDAGDILLQQPMCIEAEDTAITLKHKAAEFGADLLLQSAIALRDGTASRTPQNEQEAMYVSKLSREDGELDWTQSAAALHNHVRGFTPWPGTFCTLPDGQILKVHQTTISESNGAPGEIIQTNPQFLVGTGSGALELITVQPSGKRKMPIEDFLKGHSLELGATLPSKNINIK